MGISAGEYPELPSVSDGVGLTLPQNLLRSMIRQTLFAVAQTDARPVHTGVQFELEEGILRLVAVDGTRLAMRKEEVKSGETMQFVVPGKTLSEVLKLLSDEDTPAALAVGPAPYRAGNRRLCCDFPSAGRGISPLSQSDSPRALPPL